MMVQEFDNKQLWLALHTHVSSLFIVKFLGFFQVCEWHITQLGILCDIRPDCHHHFFASGTSNAMFDETYVCKASHNCLLSNSCTFFGLYLKDFYGNSEELAFSFSDLFSD